MPYEPSVDELRALHVEDELVAQLEGSTFRRKAGCPRCGNTGYRGRIGVFQLLEMTGTLERLASENASREEIERAALDRGDALALARRRRQGRSRDHDGRRARPRLHRLASEPAQNTWITRPGVGVRRLAADTQQHGDCGLSRGLDDGHVAGSA